MSKFKVTREYYDGSSVEYEDIGLIRGDDLATFVDYLLRCGYEGRMGKKHGCFSATINPGPLDYHDSHFESICIDKIKKLKALSPANWKKEIRPFAEKDYVKTSDGVYVWRGSDDDDDDICWDGFYESASNDEDKTAEDELDFEKILKKYERDKK